MSETTVAPFGSWVSPITSGLIVADAIGLRRQQVVLDGDDIYWSESRPSEGGRVVVVRRTPDGRVSDVTPAPFNARSRVHEYGGGAFAVDGGTLVFSNAADGRLYLLDVARPAAPRPLTPEVPDAARRYADIVFDRRRDRLVAVREDHTAGGHEPVNAVVSVPLTGADPHPGEVLVRGNSFYAAPRLSSYGSRLAWLTWNQPDMPWDGTELWAALVGDDGAPGPAARVAGGRDESIFQPEWAPDGTLYYVSDRTGWWNLYRRRDNGDGGDGDEALHSMEAEFGLPLWNFGMSTYAFASADVLVCAYTRAGAWRLARIDLRTLAFTPIETPYTDISSPRAADGRVVFVGASPSTPGAVVDLDLATGAAQEVRHARAVAVDPGYLSVPRAIDYPARDGATAHAFYYPPRNRDYAAPPGERPPLLVKSHGGPTAATSTALDLTVQYWTSRGVAVLDVDYGGSTGYGRAYRARLDGQWGIVDVDDCVDGARYLAGRGEVDGGRLAIDGGSAGGYTTLCALVFRDDFKAGASYYGVSDLEALARDTHKFEARYLDRMVGPYPARRDLYVERSPIHHVDRLSAPAVFLQGAEDKVVPPDQAERMVAALRAKGLPVAYLLFEGEGHGFRRAENIARALDAELYFFARVFGFTPADPIEPVAIENL